jgi:hypothetical protein
MTLIIIANTAPSFHEGEPHPSTPSINWNVMFQQLKDYHDLGHTKGYPPRIARWMSAQRRQYRPYGIGKKDPIGIIKQRIKKLNSLGFSWDAPINADEGAKKVEEIKKKSKIKHNLLAAGIKVKSMNTNQEYNYLSRSGDFLSPEKTKDQDAVKQTQSSRGRVRVPSRRMQESYETNMQIDVDEVDKNATQKKNHDDDISTITSGDGSSQGATTKSNLFPGVMLDMINDINETNPNILEWLPNGKGFRINDVVSKNSVLAQFC